MKMTPEELEQFIHSELRNLPARRAPLTLESRVMAALEHRASIPWYHKSWSYWPAPVRMAFLAIGTAISGGAVIAFSLMTQGVAVSTQAGGIVGAAARLYNVALWAVDFVNHILASIPPLWLYGGLAAFGALYATVFGLGAAAYRTLHRQS